MPKDPRSEMEVVYDGLAPIIGEPGSDDEVASTYDCGVQNDVGRESMRKKREANDGYHRRQRRKFQKTHHPAVIPSSSRPAAAVVEDARAMIEERREDRGEEETQEEKEEREWQREQQRQIQEALKRQKRFEEGDFSGCRIVEEGPAPTPSGVAPRQTQQRKSAVRARQMIASANKGTNIKSLMRFPIGAPNRDKDLRLQRALPSTSSSKEIRRTLFSEFVDAMAEPTQERATKAQSSAMEVVVSRHTRTKPQEEEKKEEEEEEKSLRQVIREEVTSALRQSMGSRGWSREGGERSGWTPSPLPERQSSPAPRRQRSPLPQPRRPASRQDRREDRSRHSVDRRFQSQPSRRLPRRSPSPASHRARDVDRKFRGERDFQRRREASPTDRSRPRRPSPAPSSRSSKSESRPPARAWKKERESRR